MEPRTSERTSQHVLLTEEQIQRAASPSWPRRSTPTTPARTCSSVGVLKGAVMVMADLARALHQPVDMDWMAVSSYGSGTKSTGVVRILKDLDADINGRHVLIVEDIIDSGLTLSWLLQEPGLARPGVGRGLHPAAQAGGREGPRRVALRRLRHPERVRRRVRPRLRRALPQPAGASAPSPRTSTGLTVVRPRAR